MNQQSVMQHRFSEVPSAEIPRSIFNRSHAYKTCFDGDKLIPFYIDEALPGDTLSTWQNNRPIIKPLSLSKNDRPFATLIP